MPNLIGKLPNQVPVNGMLGTAAFVDLPQLPVSTATQAALDAKVGTTGPQSVTASSTSPALLITQEGTGNALEVRDVAGDNTPFVVDGAGRVAIASVPGITGAALTIGGDAPTGLLDVFRSSADAGGFSTRFFKNRNASIYGNTLVQNNDVLGALNFAGADGTNYINGAFIRAEVDGTPGTNDMPGRLVFSTTADGASSPTERMRITQDGRVLANNSTGLGYGAGSGGTVTQATSKSTAVTLNKPSGQITMAADALAAGESVVFTLVNSTIGAGDSLVFNLNVGGGVNYNVWAANTFAGNCAIAIKNISAVALGQAVVINFAVLKGSAT